MIADTGVEGSPAPAVEVAPAQPLQRWATPGFAFVSVVATGWLLYVGRYTTFFFDEWEFVIHRSGGLDEGVFSPHAGHPSLVPVAIYRGLFAVVGIRHYLPYRLVLLGLHVLVCALLFVYARRRVPLPLALTLATVLLFFGSAWNDLLWPFQIGYLASLAAIMGALLLLDRGDGVGDAGACACLVVAVTSSSLGLPALAAVATQVGLSSRRLRRSWIVVAPVVAYAGLVLSFPGGAGLTGKNLGEAPSYVAAAAAAVVRALFGVGTVIGGGVAIAGLALVLYLAWRDPGRRGPLAVVAALPASFWVLTALARADLGEPGASRYLYPGALFAFLVVAECARSTRRLGAAAVGGLTALTAVSLGVNVDPLLDGKRFLTQVSVKLRAELAALEIAGPALVDTMLRPEPVWAPDITAGRYFDVVDRLGSPTYGAAELVRRSKVERYDADRVFYKAGLLRLGGAVVADEASGRAPALGPFVQGLQATQGPCTSVTAPGDAVVTVAVPPEGIVVTAGAGGATVSARRFGDEFSIEPIVELAGGTSTGAVPVADSARAPWHVLVRGQPSVTVCAAAPEQQRAP